MDKSPAEELKMMIGTPVYVEHDSKRVIGEVTYAQTDADGKIQIEWRKIESVPVPGAPKAALPKRPEQKE